MGGEHIMINWRGVFAGLLLSETPGCPGEVVSSV